MIQFKKIPPSKSALLLLLFLTTNVYGFLRDQNEYQVSRKTQNRLSMDLQEPVDHNMPIRKIGNDRIINEKDRNAQRLYDRRSFRTGTEESQNRERSIELQRRSRDLNNNRERFTNPEGVRNIRDNRRSFESTISREYRQRLVQNSRSTERAVISRNRQYEERSLDAKTERDLNRRNERSSDVRERRHLHTKDLNQRINERRTSIEARSINEHREVRDRLDNRRVVDRELPQRQTEERLTERRSERLSRRSTRSADIRDRRTSNERDFDQQRSERFERMNSREVPLASHDRRVSERRSVDQNRLSDEDRRVGRVLSSTGRSQRRSVTIRDRRVSEDRQNRLAERLERASIRENALQRRIADIEDRISENRNTVRSRLSVERRSTVRSDRSISRDRLVRDLTREDRTRAVPDQTRREFRDASRRSTLDRRDQRLSERDIRHSYAPDTRRTTERSQRDTITSRAMDDNRSSSREARSMSSQSRSDSTRYIQDNSRSRNVRLTYRKDFARLSREDRRQNENSRRETIRITDRYDPLTADSRRYFEKIVSQRATRDTVRNNEMPTLGLERNIKNNDTYSWASTAKVILAVFLIGQIFVNSSKANKFRFHNIVSMATSLKEKVH